MTRWINLKTILAAYLILATAYSLATPIFEAPDEMAHFAYVKNLVNGQGFPALPIRTSDDSPAQESSQSPLYYSAAALFVRLMAPDTADFSALLQRNRVFPYITTEFPNDNKNVFLHAIRQEFPYQGATRGVHVARLVAILFGAAAVAATYGLARAAFAGWRGVPLIAAAVVAFLPQFIFTSAAVSNDSAVTAGCAAALWATVVVMRSGLTLRRAAILGAALALAALSKASGLALVSLSLVAIGVAFLTKHLTALPLHKFLAGIAVTVGVFALLAGLWYLRSYLVFGDALGIAPHQLMPWARSPFLPFLDSLRELPRAVPSFWLALGWNVIVVPDWVYWILNVFGVLGLAGACVAWMRSDVWVERGSILLLSSWIVLVVLALIRWNQLFDAVLGRLLFPALPAVGVLLAVGWTTLALRFFKKRARLIAGLPAAGLFALSVLAIPLLLLPAFAAPALLSEAEILQQAGRPIDIRYGDTARLIRIDVPRGGWPQPGGNTTLRLCWEVLGVDARNLLAFVHLVGPQNRIIAVRRTHPGLGNYPTSSWQPGARFCDEMHLKIDRDVAAPAIYRVEVGLLDEHTLQRLPTYSPAGTLLESNFVDWIKIAPAAYAVPAIENPLNIRFADQIELAGYAGVPAAVEPGDELRVQLDWRALQRPNADFTVFVHLRGAGGHTVVQADSQPQAGTYPTSFWDAGETVVDDHTLVIPDVLPSGDYTVAVGLYRLDTGERLAITQGSGGSEITLPQAVRVR